MGEDHKPGNSTGRGSIERALQAAARELTEPANGPPQEPLPREWLELAASIDRQRLAYTRGLGDLD